MFAMQLHCCCAVTAGGVVMPTARKEVLAVLWHSDGAASIVLSTRDAWKWLKASPMQQRRMLNGRIML